LQLSDCSTQPYPALGDLVTNQDTSDQTVRTMADAVGVPLSEEESANLVAGLWALAADMTSLDAMDLRDVEPAPVFQALPQAKTR